MFNFYCAQICIIYPQGNLPTPPSPQKAHLLVELEEDKRSLVQKEEDMKQLVESMQRLEDTQER